MGGDQVTINGRSASATVGTGSHIKNDAKNRKGDRKQLRLIYLGTRGTGERERSESAKNRNTAC